MAGENAAGLGDAETQMANEDLREHIAEVGGDR